MTDLVRNAADPRQVKHAGRKERDARKRDLADLRELMGSAVFRRFAWRLMGFCGYGENPTHARGDMTHQNIGRADVARWLVSEIGEAGGIDAWLLMQREAWVAKRSDEVEAEAVRTPSALEPINEEAHT
jgi:hypothetical protein